jgi:DNA-binding MarR family transcriptional regulator
MADPTADECIAMRVTCACYNLRRASRAVTLVFDAYFEDLGLKATQFTVLVSAADQSKGRLTVNDLAAALVLEQSSLSRNLAVLERLGYIRLVRGDDRRERFVTLTRSGRAAIARGFPLWKQAQARIAAAFADGDLDQQLRSLRRLTKTALEVRPPRRSRSAATPKRTKEKQPRRAL